MLYFGLANEFAQTRHVATNRNEEELKNEYPSIAYNKG